MATYHIETYGCTPIGVRADRSSGSSATRATTESTATGKPTWPSSTPAPSSRKPNMLRRAEELECVVAAVPVPVKVIVEAPLLSDDELRTACELAADADADYVKTATGFSVGGATVDDVRVMSEYLPVKASGSGGDFEAAVAMLEAGAERIGASSGAAIIEEYDAGAF